MKDISRRRLLAVGILGRTATLAGCLARPDPEQVPGGARPDGETDADPPTRLDAESPDSDDRRANPERPTGNVPDDTRSVGDGQH